MGRFACRHTLKRKIVWVKTDRSGLLQVRYAAIPLWGARDVADAGFAFVANPGEVEQRR